MVTEKKTAKSAEDVAKITGATATKSATKTEKTAPAAKSAKTADTKSATKSEKTADSKSAKDAAAKSEKTAPTADAKTAKTAKVNPANFTPGDAFKKAIQAKKPQKLIEINDENLEEYHAKIKARVEVLADKIVKIGDTDYSKSSFKNAFKQLNDLESEFSYYKSSFVKCVPKSAIKKVNDARYKFNLNWREFNKDFSKNANLVMKNKQDIIDRARAFVAKTDWDEQAEESPKWAEGSKFFHNSLEEFKKAGRTKRETDDELFEAFADVRNSFYKFKERIDVAMTAKMEENFEAKIKLLAEAQKILPIKDIDSAAATLNSIQDRWNKIGQVPRDKFQKIENDLQKVFDELSALKDKKFEEVRNNTDDRVSEFKQSIIDSIEKLKAQIENADSKDKNKLAKLKDELKGKEALLKIVK